MSQTRITTSHSPLALSAAMMIALILLINISFKIIVMQGMMFSITSVLSVVIACLYWLILKNTNAIQSRQILNQSLLGLYLFSIGIYVLINLPTAQFMRDQTAYQIVFDDIPKKFFASTLSFGLCFYLPHFLFFSKKLTPSITSGKRFLLAFLGGFGFFSMNFLLLFIESLTENFYTIYLDSLMLASAMLLSAGVLYKTLLTPIQALSRLFPKNAKSYRLSRNYHSLVSFAVIILLICLACEYRLVIFGNKWTIAASGLFFPLIILTSNLVGELYGLKPNLRLALILIMTELVFDGLMMLFITLPSPKFFDLNPFYSFIMPRRIPASTLALFVTFFSNSFLLEHLKYTGYGSHRGLRILIANLIVSSLLSIVNYSLLFSGIYPYEQIFTLAINGWVYKFFFILMGIPVVLWLYENRFKLEKF